MSDTEPDRTGFSVVSVSTSASTVLSGALVLDTRTATFSSERAVSVGNCVCALPIDATDVSAALVNSEDCSILVLPVLLSLESVVLLRLTPPSDNAVETLVSGCSMDIESVVPLRVSVVAPTFCTVSTDSVAVIPFCEVVTEEL